MFPFTLDIYCTSVRPGRGIPHMWLSLRFLLSFYLLKGFFSSFSWLLLRVKGRGCHTLLKPYETNCGLWIWAIQIKFDWLIDWLIINKGDIHLLLHMKQTMYTLFTVFVLACIHQVQLRLRRMSLPQLRRLCFPHLLSQVSMQRSLSKYL